MPDFDALAQNDLNELRNMIETGNYGEESADEPVEGADAKLPDADEIDAAAAEDTADDPKDDPEAEKGDDADGDDPDSDDAADTPEAPFEFTENADIETFAAETDAMLAAFDFSEMPEVATAINRWKDEAVALNGKIQQYESLGPIETVRNTVDAFNQILEFTKDEDTGEFVPNTQGVVNLLNSDFKNEKERILYDLNTQPSDKYAGLTQFEAFLKDYGNLNEDGIRTLAVFLENGGQLPVPQFTPPGVDVNVAEAFWKASNRADIEAEIEDYVFTLKDQDATDHERQQAKLGLQRVNANLAQIQRGMDADRKTAADREAFEQHRAQQLEATAETSFFTAVNTISDSLSDTIAKSLTFVEGTGASLTAKGITATIRQAFSEREWEAKIAQESLAKDGIVADWTAGRKLLDDLYDVEMKLAHQTADPKTNPRAIENTRLKKAELLRSLRREEIQVAGKIAAAVVKNSSKTLEKKVANAPKLKAVRQRIPATGDRTTAKPNFDETTPEGLQKLRESILKRAVSGDLSGYR